MVVMMVDLLMERADRQMVDGPRYEADACAIVVPRRGTAALDGELVQSAGTDPAAHAGRVGLLQQWVGRLTAGIQDLASSESNERRALT